MGRSAYNLRLPPKASGKDTGPWPAPGFKGLRLTVGRRPSNDVWRMVWEDWAEILRANPGRAMLRTEAGIMRSACLHGSSLGLCWTQGVPMLGQVGTMLSHLGPILGLCWAKSGLALQPSSFWSVASVFHPSWHPLSCPFGIASQARSPLVPWSRRIYTIQILRLICLRPSWNMCGRILCLSSVKSHISSG